VAEFSKLDAAASLAAANKRVSNILAKQDGEPSALSQEHLVEPAEKDLAQAVESISTEVAPLFADSQYAQALTALSKLREPVDAFFDQVMVMAEDETLRNNRLALLRELRALFLEVADISYLVPAKS
jgi:glycyl-tRNA synthetase beta chain